MSIVEALNMDTQLATRIFKAAAELNKSQGSSSPQVTRSGDGIVRHHITSFDQLQAVVGGIK